MTNTIAVIYHSGFGHTKVVAQSVAEGANLVEGIDAQVISVEEIGTDYDQLDEFDAMIFGAPTYMGDISAPMKAFMDGSAGKWFGSAWKDKIAAGFSNAGNASGDKLRALESLQGFAMQHGMIWVGYGEKAGVNPETGEEDGHNTAGHWVGLGTISGNDDPSKTPSEIEHSTARYFGKRVAEATIRWNK